MPEFRSYAEVAAQGGPNGTSNDHEDMPHKLQHEGYEVGGRAIDDYPPGKPYSVAIEEVPVTYERIPYVPRQGDPLVDAGTARATRAPSKESPNGSPEWSKKCEHRTVVMQHVSYWDQDEDGIIWPQDTYVGCRKFGWSPPLAFLAAFVINVNLSYPTCPSWIPDPFFRIWVQRLHKDKHGSDSMTYDSEGRFRPQNFEDIFAKYDRGNKGGLDAWDLVRLWNGQRMVFDFFGWSATALEWLATYLLLWPDDGILRKEDVRRTFDGSIFEYKANEYQRKQKLKREQNKDKTKKPGWNFKAKLF